MSDKITAGKFVTLAYDIRVIAPDGEVSVFTFTDDKPDTFVFGNEPGMLPAFMSNIEGLAAGEKFDFTVAPENAFGKPDPEMVIDVPREVFVVDGEFDSEMVQVDNRLPMRFEGGQMLYGRVVEITDTHVKMDFNHELAGETIRYEGTVLGVRDATADELNPPHHCGCGCDHGHADGCNCDDCSGCQ